jgi:signal peptidase I
MKISHEEFKELKKNFKGFTQVKVLTPSMSPLIMVNDMVKVASLPNDLNTIKPYDILIFWQDNKLICHFFIKIENGLFITRGLNSKRRDEPIKVEDLFGIVIHPKVGRFKRIFLKFLLR